MSTHLWLSCWICCCWEKKLLGKVFFQLLSSLGKYIAYFRIRKKTVESHVIFNKPLGKRPVQLGVLALIADTFHNWIQSEHWRASIFDELYSNENLFEIQQFFYLFLYRSAFYHAVQGILLLLLNLVIFKAPLKLLIKAFLLSLSVKNIYIPLLVWQTTELPSFAPTVFTQVISTLFLSFELEVLSLKKHSKLQVLLFAAFAQVVPYFLL